MIEGPGHVPLHKIKINMDKQLKECGGLRSHHLVDCLATALPEGGVHFPDGVGV
jgi:phosphomethylpyrimidine synthase